jgi:hypothetical protein
MLLKQTFRMKGHPIVRMGSSSTAATAGASEEHWNAMVMTTVAMVVMKPFVVSHLTLSDIICQQN